MARFRGLSEAQERVFEQIAIGNDRGHHPRTLDSLLEKKIIERYAQFIGGWPPMTINRYGVPIPVHIEWCKWSSEKEAGNEE